MATIGVFRIDGVKTNPPNEGQDITLESSFGDNNVQPNVSPLKLTFANGAARTIIDYIDAGNIYEGLNFNAEVIGKAGTVNIIDGFLDLANDYERISPIQVITEAKFLNGITNLDKKLQALTFDLLAIQGEIVEADYTRVQFVSEKKFDAVEVIISSVTLYLMLKELAESTEKLGADLAMIPSLTAAGATGGIGAVIYQVAIIL